jgi:N-methylhydantoinase B
LVPLDRLTPMVGKFDADGNPDPADGTAGLGTEFQTAKLTDVAIEAGEVLLLMTASGGGYGDPLDRDPELVRLDVWNERVSVGAAERMYAVLIDPDTLIVDEDATSALRAQRRGEPVPVAMYRPWPRTEADLPSKIGAGSKKGEPA